MNAGQMLLLPLSWVYGGILSLRNLCYDRGWIRSHSVGIPVISIGNITVGGTGKTPMAEFLLAKLLAMGHQPAYLSRGYGRKTKGFVWVIPQNGTSAEYGDEAFQVAAKFPGIPVVVCEDRVAGALLLLAQKKVDVLVLDDAFQHRRIRRDLDIVMMDVSRMPTKDHLLPTGRLREPLRGLTRANVLLLTKFASQTAFDAAQTNLAQQFPAATIAKVPLLPFAVRPFDDDRFSDRSLAELKGLPVFAFSGLGNNAHFHQTLVDIGADVQSFTPFPDHHAFTERDLENLFHAFESLTKIKGKFAPALILTTEKDYFRIKSSPWLKKYEDLPMYYLEVGMAPAEGWEIVEQKIKNITSKV